MSGESNKETITGKSLEKELFSIRGLSHHGLEFISLYSKALVPYFGDKRIHEEARECKEGLTGKGLTLSFVKGTITIAEIAFYPAKYYILGYLSYSLYKLAKDIF